MYPFLRFLLTIIHALLSKPVSPSDETQVCFRCMPWDIDMFFEMNNGRVLTLYDLGRFAYSVRSGLMLSLRKNKWGMVVAGSSVRYRMRIRMFDKVCMKTRVVALDDRWIYVVQSMWVKGQPASSALIRAAVTERGKTILTERVLESMGIDDWKPEPEGWIKSWVEAETARPWPP